jgi:hypothetical protein
LARRPSDDLEFFLKGTAMKTKTISYLAAGALLAIVAAANPAQAQISMSIGQPGFYGSIDINDAPPPVLVYQQPVMIEPMAVEMAPLYLYVPPQQYRHWREYCGRYDACDRPVYFVDDNWYQRQYVPHYRSHRGEYERRRAEFERRNAYRPPGREAHRNTSPAPVREAHRNTSPAPVREAHRNTSPAPVREDHRNTSAAPVREAHRNAPPAPVKEYRKATSPPAHADDKRSHDKEHHGNR